MNEQHPRSIIPLEDNNAFHPPVTVQTSYSSIGEYLASRRLPVRRFLDTIFSSNKRQRVIRSPKEEARFSAIRSLIFTGGLVGGGMGLVWLLYEASRSYSGRPVGQTKEAFAGYPEFQTLWDELGLINKEPQFSGIDANPEPVDVFTRVRERAGIYGISQELHDWCLSIFMRISPGFLMREMRADFPPITQASDIDGVKWGMAGINENGWDWLPHFDLIKDNWKANIEAGLFIIHYLLRKFPPQHKDDREWIGWFAEVFGQQRSEFVGQVHALFNTRFYDGRYPHLLDLPPTWVVTQRNHHETRTDQPGWAWDRGYCGNPKTRHGILIYAPMDCEVTDIWRYPQSKTTVMELTSPEGIHAHYLHQTGFVEGDPPYYQFTVRGQPKVIAIGTQLNKGEAMAQFGEEGYKPLRDNQGNIVYRLNELGERVPVMVSMGPHVHCEFWDPNNNPIDLSTITLPYYEQNGCGAYMWPSD